MRRLRGIRKLNNSAAICVDSRGREVIVMGKGVGFGEFPREILLSQIERSFYNINEKDQNVMRDLPPEVVLFTAKMMDIIKNELPYEMNPNAVLVLADHISFAMERMKKNLRVKMPLAYDIRQMYPAEYKIAKYIVARIRKEFKVALPEEEISGIAMNLINARAGEDTEKKGETEEFNDMLEEITEIVEKDFRIIVDRDSFDFSRYATHLQYLFQRIKAGKAINSANLQLYPELCRDFPELAECAEHVACHIRAKWSVDLSDEERLYLMLHINRICVREGL